ncbi:cupin domain-containing protein [Salinirubrum litoreum]|uniref:Cupin domain-containing protein n=1 Tax=Salinirubrum litoreum TaxID=1126234 RepID=A0ABD5R8Y0_9EURY|nr:cupin domain-containing protein [Salinirubrum litoreum]
MERVAIESLESSHPAGGDVDRRGLTDALDADDLAVNYYALDPGDAFSGGMHAHYDQEEVFYVMEGTATFETMSDPTAESETVEVGPQEAIRFAAGEFQQGRNESDERVTALALGAPTPSTDVRVPTACAECGDSETLAVGFGDDGEMRLACPECGTELSV